MPLTVTRLVALGRLRLLLAVALLAATLVAAAVVPASAGASTRKPPQLDAASWLLIDLKDGAELAARAPGERRAIASTTKLMTAYVALHELPLDRIVRAAPTTPIYGESLLDLRRAADQRPRPALRPDPAQRQRRGLRPRPRRRRAPRPASSRDEPLRGGRLGLDRHPLRQPDRPRRGRQLLERRAT